MEHPARDRGVGVHHDDFQRLGRVGRGVPDPSTVAGTNNGLIVKDSVESSGSANSNKYSSREGADPPQLMITFG